MNSRVTNLIFGVITVAALGFAAYIYVNQSDKANPIVTASLAPSTAVSASPTLKASPLATVTPLSSPSINPSASPTTSRIFKDIQPLSLPGEVETIATGGSLFAIAQAHSIATSELAKLNGITDVDKVYAGQVIIIPDSADNFTYTFLFVTNPNRLTKEKQKLAAGGSSLYSDSITAAQTDTKGIYGLTSDTAFTKLNEKDTAVTLTATLDTGTVTLSMEKNEANLWLTKKMIIKTSDVKASP